MPVPSTFFYVATAASAALSGTATPHWLGQPTFLGSTVTLEKLYSQGEKIVGSPIMNVAEANEKCPNGFVVRREARDERGPDVYLTWTLTCY